VPLQPAFTDAVDTVLRSWDRAAVHAVVLTSLVLISLFLVNTRGAYYFVLALVSPRELPEPVETKPQADPTAAAAAASQPGYTVRVGPLVATVEPGVRPGAEPATVATAVREGGDGVLPGTDTNAGGPVGASPAPTDPVPDDPAPSTRRARTAAVPSGAPMMIGATIGALERLLIVAFVLVGAEAAVGFVIAAKTIARFKQLDDRGFAEYYLLGTLGSVSVALGTAIIAKAALATIP
jgi:hypothetical protein